MKYFIIPFLVAILGFNATSSAYPIDTVVTIPFEGFGPVTLPFAFSGIDTVVKFDRSMTASCPGGGSEDFALQKTSLGYNRSLVSTIRMCGGLAPQDPAGSYTVRNAGIEYKIVSPKKKTIYMMIDYVYMGKGDSTLGTHEYGYRADSIHLVIDTTSFLPKGKPVLFPLGNGDKWFYRITGTKQYYETKRATHGLHHGRNGKEYKMISGKPSINTVGSSTAFYRVAGSRVYSYDRYKNRERMLFDFSAEPGDTVARYPSSGMLAADSGHAILTKAGKRQILGRELRYWVFSHDFDRGVADDEGSIMVADSIGIVSSSSGWSSSSLKGACIDGTCYGITSRTAERSFKPQSSGTMSIHAAKNRMVFTFPATNHRAKLEIFDALGRCVWSNPEIFEGTIAASWYSGSSANGLYVARLTGERGTLFTRSFAIVK